MNTPPNSLGSSVVSSVSVVAPTEKSNSASSVSSIRSSQLKVLKVAPNLENFAPSAIINPKDVNLRMSTIAPMAFRRHLYLVKNEDKALHKLLEDLENQSIPPINREDSSHLSNELMQDKGSKSNLMTLRNESSYMLPKLSKQPRDLDPSKRISLDQVLSKYKVPQLGKYLLCLNGTLPALSHNGETFVLNTVVEENFCNSKAIRVEIFCDLKSAETFFHLLKHPYSSNMEPGSVILIQDPTLTDSVTNTDGIENICIQTGSAKHVEFLSWQTFQSLIPRNDNGPKRGSFSFERVPAEHPTEHLGERSGTTFISLAIENKSAAEEWRQWGNEYSVARLHTLAFFAYSICMRFEPDSVELAASRSASLISLGFYKAALSDVDFITAEDPFNTGYILRKINCFWGLGKHEEALEYLKTLLTRLVQGSPGGIKEKKVLELDPLELKRKSIFIQRIIVKTEDMIERRDIPDLIGSEKYFRNSPKLFYDEPEYYQPVRVSYEDPDDIKSRKIVRSTQHVKAGNLLVITKALSVVFLNEANKLLVDANDELMNATIQKIQLDKPTKSSIYKFSCSEEILAGRECDETDKCLEFSKEEIKNLCESYFYSCDTPQESSSLSNAKVTAIGIWPFMRNIRHACVGGNAVWYTCGNLLFVRAIRDVLRGEEIIIAHIEPTEPYGKRTTFLEKRGMTCTCPLCTFEKNESDMVKTKRLGLLNEVHIVNQITSPDWSKDFSGNQIKKIQFCIEDLIVLRSAYARLNFPIVEPLMNYGQHLMTTEKFDEAIRAFEKAFSVVDNTSSIFAQIVLSLYLSYCYIAKKRNRDKNRSKKWFIAMKSYAMLLYGCLDPVKFHFRAEFEFLENKGIATLN